MATIGQSLTSPQAGWSRCGIAASPFAFLGTWTKNASFSASYEFTNNTGQSSTTEGDTIKFKFSGTKLLIKAYANMDTSGFSLKIDGVDKGNVSTATSATKSVVVYEDTTLSNSIHEVEMKVLDKGLFTGSTLTRVLFDCIDIDSTGLVYAIVGSLLTAPEVGWRRYDDLDRRISYSGGTWKTTTAGTEPNAYNLAYSFASTGGVIEFSFVGTKLRFIAVGSSNRTSDTLVTIDDVSENFSQFLPSTVNQALLYEKTGLPDKLHKVTITNTGTGVFSLDALDIDSAGYLVARIGQVLTAPDEGWQRVDNAHPAIKYEGSWGFSQNSTGYFNSTRAYTNTREDRALFSFVGTKLRIISNDFTTGGNAQAVIIDGNTEHFSNYRESALLQVLQYEKLGLSDGMHTVEIVMREGTELSVDAIDIDTSGRVLHPDEVTDVRDLDIGKRIRCHYRGTSLTAGTFSDLGKQTADFINPLGATSPQGDFYFIMIVDWNGQKRLIADRNVHMTISWDALVTAGYASGSGLPVRPIPTRQRQNPVMASNTSPSGRAFSSNTNTGAGLTAYYAFDNSLTASTAWGGNALNGGYPYIVGYQFPAPTFVDGYDLTINNSSYYPTDYEVQGSSDGVEYTTLHKVVSGTYGIRSVVFPEGVTYTYYRLYITQLSQVSSGLPVVYELAFTRTAMLLDDASVNCAIRLPTGGASGAALYADNEWDNYVVKSTLNDTIVAGDNRVWNWSGLPSWASTTLSGITSARASRGSSAVGAYSSATTSTSSARGFRPVLVIDIASSPPVFAGSLDNTTVHKGDATLTGVITDPESKDVGYQILVNGLQVYPQVGYTELAPSPLNLSYTVLNSLLRAGSNSIQINMINDNGDISRSAFSVSLTNVAPAISASVAGSTLTLEVTDLEADTVKYQILLNGLRVFPLGDQQFTELAPPPVSRRITFRSDEINIGTGNVVTIVALDSYDAQTSIDIPFVGMYAGLMFSDEQDRLYSTDLGKVLQLLDIGTLVSGQTSLVYPIKLTNFTGATVENIVIAKDMKSNPLEVDLEFSYTETPFTSVHALQFLPKVDNNGSVTFYVRVVTQPVEEPSGGEFDILVKADPAD